MIRNFSSRAATALHRVLARSRALTFVYLSVAGFFLKRLGTERLRRAFIRSINRVVWPEVEFPPQTVRIGNATQVRLAPKLYYGASDSLITNTLGFEKEVFAYFESVKFNYQAVVDIGAYIGVHTVFFAARAAAASRAGDCRFFSFEPCRASYDRLLTNIGGNSVRGVTTFNCALGGETRFAELYRPVMFKAYATFSRDHAMSFGSRIDTERVLIADASMVEKLTAASSRVLIKMDVEGTEAEILMRLKDWIVAKKPTIVLEVLDTFRDRLDKLSFLHKAGYRYLHLTDKGEVERNKFEPSVEFRNYLLVPKD